MTRNPWRRAAAVALALGALAASPACSSSDDEAAPSTAPTTTTVPTTASTAPPATAAPGRATGGVTVTPDPVPVAEGGTAPVTVTWEGQEPRTLMFLTVCRKPTADPSFDVAADCSPLSEITPNGTPDGSGTAQVEVFRGPTPEGDGVWGCFAEADEPPSGVQKNTTCYVRVTNDVVLNDEDAREVPFTIVPG